MTKFKQGEDLTLKILVLEDEVDVNLAPAVDVRVVLKVGNLVIDKFAKAVAPEILPATIPPTYGPAVVPAGYKTLTVNASKSNQIDAVLNSAVTKIYPTGAVKAIVQADFTDATFADGIRTESYEIWVATVEKGETPL